MGSFNWIGEYNAAAAVVTDAPTPTRRRSNRLHRVKKLEYLGWGSRQLIEFLDSIGKETAKQIPQYDVAQMIADYVNQRKLLNPLKKKRIVCDDALRSLFGRKSIARIKIYDLLQPHFTENLEEDSDESSDDDEVEQEQEDEDEQAAIRKQLRKRKKTRPPLYARPPPRSCYAAVIPENLKLVYLRRSVVEALAKQEKVFEEKVVGSFVRTKSVPNDYTQKNSYQLMQVKAVIKKPNSDSESSRGVALLQLHGAVKDFPISMLSDDNFSPEECADLRERVKSGFLKRLTVVELQQKVQVLHLDVTKHWLVRELQYLQNLIDRANEKGWRRELFDYLEKRQLLQSPDEQARLLREVPEVIVEELEVEPKGTPDEIEQGNHGSPGQILRGDSVSIHSEVCEDDDSLLDRQKQPTESVERVLDEPKYIIVEDNKASHQLVDKHVASSDVVDLTDANDDKERENEKYEIPIPQLNTSMWHYVDPQGNVQGPFSIISLKRWSDSDYFPPDFKIWKTGIISVMAFMPIHAIVLMSISRALQSIVPCIFDCFLDSIVKESLITAT